MGAKFLKLILVTLVLVMFTGCGESKATPWITVGDKPVYEGEVMLYLYQTFNDFEKHGGKDVWLVEDFSGGKSAGELAKQGAVDNLIRSKVMVRKAKEIGILIDGTTMAELTREAQVYFEDLPSAFVMSYGITIEDVEAIFLENNLAMEVVKRTTENREVPPTQIREYIYKNPNYARLSVLEAEDVLTTYRIQHLVIRTHIRDEYGEWQPLEEEQQVEAKVTMDALYEELLEGAPFMEIVRRASETDYYHEEPSGIVISRAQLPENYKASLDEIDVGEFTPIIQGEYGHNVLYLLEKVIPTEEDFLRYEERFSTWEEALEAEAEAEIIKETVEVIYKRWREATTVTYDDQWTNLDFIETIQTFIETGSEQ